MRIIFLHALFLRTFSFCAYDLPPPQDTPIAGAPPLSGWNTGEVYTVANSR